MNKDIRTGLKENLRHNLLMMRTMRGYTLLDVENATGLIQGTISAWERGETEPVATHLYTVARFYGVSVEFLFEDWAKVLRKFHGILDN